MSTQFGERNALPLELVEKRGHGAVQLRHLHLHTAILDANFADPRNAAQSGLIE